jgi:cyclic pyranopterin phosphate synthase
MHQREGKIIAVSISSRKGEEKKNVAHAELRKGHGIVGDAHSGNWHRQISLLAIESIDKMRAKGLDVNPGDFAENITTEGIDLVNLSVGAKIQINDDVVLEVTQIGKECHDRCHIYYSAGDCIMPTEGIFAKVIKGGSIEPNDEIIVVNLEAEINV